MVSEISKSIKKIRENCQYNFKTLSEQRSKIENEIEQDRITINDYLDKLQKDTLKELHEMEKKTNKEIHQVIQSLDEKENKTMEFQRNISTIKQHASDLHAFLALKKLENDVLAEEKFLQSLIDNNCLKQYSLIYQPNSTVKPSSLGTFGQVLIETKLLDFVLIGIKGKQAQMTVHKKGPKSFEDISLRLHRAINGTGRDIRGCSLLQDDKTVFTNHSSDSIRILKKDGSLDYDVKLWHYAYDVECITKDTLVVTSGDSNSKCISIVDMKYNGVKKRIPLDSDSYGIAGTDPDGDFIYSGGEKGIHRINLHEKLYSQIFLEENPSYCCVATFGNNIYHTNCITNSVTCSNVKGDKQWTFNDDTILMFPFGISVDNNGNVFVVGRHSQNVVVISADGKRHREVLSLEDGLSNPVCLHYDRSTNQLLVANDHSRAFIYDCV